MHLVDLVSLAGLGYGYVRGRTQGLARELYRLVHIGVVLLAGCSLYKLVGKLLGFVPGLEPERSGLLGFLTVVVLSAFIMRKVRRKLRALLEARFAADTHRGIAGLIGLTRWALAIVGVLVGLVLSGVPLVSYLVAEASWIGRLVAAALSATPTDTPLP